MKNLKILELDGDAYWIFENNNDGRLTTRPYPLDQIASIKGLEKLRLKHSQGSNCIKACGHKMLDLLPKMPNIKIFEIQFRK